MTDVFWLQLELTERFKRQYINKSTFYECLREIWDVLDIIYPFPVCHIMEPLEDFVTVHFRKFDRPEFCGVIEKRDPPKKSDIIVNSNNPKPTIRFALCHEIMHWFTSPPDTHYSIMGRGRQGIGDYYANEGSAEFEVPYRVFIPWVGDILRLVKNPRPELIERIKEDAVRKFDTSPAIIYYRLEGLKYEISQYASGIELDKLVFLSNAQQRTRGIVIESLNDIEKKQKNAYRWVA